MPINLQDKNAYVNLGVAIEAFERGALESQRRAGYLAIAQGNMYQMEVVLDSQERSLNRVNTAREKLRGASRPQDEEQFAFQQLKDPRQAMPMELNDGDEDFIELFGSGDNKFANYLEDCIGCSLRLKFDWQLQPINLLGPINGFLDLMNGALDKLKGFINPFQVLEDICWALNHLATLCPQDIILVLMGIKALLKRYLLAMFNIKLDWTVLLGPLLKALVGALADLLDNILALLMAPLDCAVAGLRSANDLLHASQDFVNSLQSAGSQVSSFLNTVKQEGIIGSTIDESKSTLLVKDVSWEQNPPTLMTVNGTPSAVVDPGRLEVGNPISFEAPKAEDALRLPTGFVLTSNATIQSALDDPTFVNATWLEKLIVPLQESIAWIRETFDKFLGSLHSLESLVGGGISASLSNIGILIFLKDIISLLVLIYKLISSNLDVKDWCSYLQTNPQVLENAFAPGFKNATVTARGEGDQTELIVKQGPRQVAVIKTCVNSRNDAERNILDNWIRTVESMSASGT